MNLKTFTTFVWVQVPTRRVFTSGLAEWRGSGASTLHEGAEV